MKIAVDIDDSRENNSAREVDKRKPEIQPAH